jgi:integrase
LKKYQGLHKEDSKKFFIKALSDYFGDKRLFEISALTIEEFKKDRKEAPPEWAKRKVQKIEQTAKDEGRKISPEETKVVETCLQRKTSDVSVNREIEVLRHMLNKAVKWGMLDQNPFDRFKDSIFFDERNDRVRFLEEGEIKRLLELSPPYLANIIKGAIFTGLRKGDLLRMKWTDLNMEKGLLIYQEEKKRGKLGIKQLNQDMILLLDTIPRGKSEYVFNAPIPRNEDNGDEQYIALPDPNGKPLKSIKRSFHTALKRAGIKDFRWHDLRHTSASHLLMRGASLKTVQEHLGHTSIAMTQRYSHPSKEFVREDIQRLNGLCGTVVATKKESQQEDSKKLVRNDQIIKNTPTDPTYATA